MRKIYIPLVIGLLILAGCRSQELTIQDVWARPGNTGGTSAVYLTVENPASTDETLTSVTSDVAETVEMHLSEMDSSGVMSMHQQPAIAIPANGKVEFGPGGLHIMLLNLRKDLRPGEKFQVTLNFQNKGALEVEAEVREP